MGPKSETVGTNTTVRARHLRECLASQRHAAEAHELAASAMDVVLSASEDGKQSWISTACAAQEIGAIEARSARGRLFALIEAEDDLAEVEQRGASPNEAEKDVAPSELEKDEPRDDTWRRAFRIALSTVRRGVAGRR
jgi:hypothetical protein